jgi:ankyrin repeat protein
MGERMRQTGCNLGTMHVFSSRKFPHIFAKSKMASEGSDYGRSENNPAKPKTDLACLVVEDFTGQFNNAALEFHISIQKSMKLDPKINEKQAEIGFTALHWAVACGNIEGAKILVKHGANVHIKDVLGFTPLFYCTGRAPNIEITKFLVEDCKANIQEKSKTYTTCLHGAALKGE